MSPKAKFKLAAWGAAAMLTPGLAPGALAADCITDAELEAVVGEQLRAGAFAVRTSALGDRRMCSGASIAQAVQSLRGNSATSGTANSPRPPASLPEPDEPPYSEALASEEDGWTFSFDTDNPDYSYSASVTTVKRYGVQVILSLDCSLTAIQANVGRMSNQDKLPEPQRSIVYAYERSLWAENPLVRIMKEGREIGRFSWNTAEGGFAPIGPARMRLLLAADSLVMTGGAEPVTFTMRGADRALERVIQKCKMRL